MGAAEAAELLELQLLRRIFLVLSGRIIALFALGARKRYDVSHCFLPLSLDVGAIHESPLLWVLFDNRADHAGAYSPATLADRET